MKGTDTLPMWDRFTTAGQRLCETAPELWPLVVQLVEGVAEPDAMSVGDLRELAAVAAHTAWAGSALAPRTTSAITPMRALKDWRLIDPEALEVPIARVEMLEPESIHELAEWARAVAVARRHDKAQIPPRPAIVEQLLAEVA